MTIDELAPPQVAEAEVERAPQTQQLPVAKPDNSGPPLRALAMVLIALGIVFAGLGLKDFTATPSGDGSALDTTAAAPEPQKAKPAEVPTGPTAAQIKAVNIRVFNNSDVVGVAGKTAKKLTGEGWKVVETGNSTLSIKRTAVYYGTGAAEKQAALEIADQLGIAAEKKTSAVSELGNGVVVVLVD